MAWECPACSEINEADDLIKCICGFELTGDPKEYKPSTIACPETEYLKKHPERKTEIRNGCLYLLDERNEKGKPHAGCTVNPKDIIPYKEKWDSIIKIMTT